MGPNSNLTPQDQFFLLSFPTIDHPSMGTFFSPGWGGVSQNTPLWEPNSESSRMGRTNTAATLLFTHGQYSYSTWVLMTHIMLSSHGDAFLTIHGVEHPGLGCHHPQEETILPLTELSAPLWATMVPLYSYESSLLTRTNSFSMRIVQEKKIKEKERRWRGIRR